MKYHSYKQLYRIILNSADATTITTNLKTIDSQATSIVTKYFFNLNIELPFTSQAKLSVKSFHTNNNNSAVGDSIAVGNIFSSTLNNRNTYQSFGTSKGLAILSHNFNNTSTEYLNPNYEMNYIDIQNNLTWLTSGIELIVDSKLTDDAGDDIGGFPEDDEWLLELLVCDDKLEENEPFVPYKPFQNTYAPTYG